MSVDGAAVAVLAATTTADVHCNITALFTCQELIAAAATTATVDYYRAVLLPSSQCLVAGWQLRQSAYKPKVARRLCTRNVLCNGGGKPIQTNKKIK